MKRLKAIETQMTAEDEPIAVRIGDVDGELTAHPGTSRQAIPSETPYEPALFARICMHVATPTSKIEDTGPALFSALFDDTGLDPMRRESEAVL